MEELILRDNGNVRPDSDELVTQELLSYLDSTNKTLGTELDPRFEEFNSFINSIDETAIIRIEPDGMSTGQYHDIDLTGSGNDDVVIEPDFSKFFGSDDFKTMAFLSAMNYVTPVTDGEILDKEYAPFTKWYTLLDFEDA
jgi:hypothetical protein